MPQAVGNRHDFRSTLSTDEDVIDKTTDIMFGIRENPVVAVSTTVL
jgi:hypothetical protein